MKVVRLSVSRTGRLYRQEMFLVLIFTRGWVDPMSMVRSEGNMSLNNPVTPPGIDPETVRLVAQRLNHYEFRIYWKIFILLYWFVLGATAPSTVGQGVLIHEASISHTLRRATLCRTPLDQWSARRRDLYLTTHNTHNKQTSIPFAGFEPTP
jgi:hypothetical protein